MTLVTLVAPPVLHLLGVLLVLITLVSPVPYHASSIALVYISPSTGSAANASTSDAMAIGSMPPSSMAGTSTAAAQTARRPDSFSMARASMASDAAAMAADTALSPSSSDAAAPSSQVHVLSPQPAADDPFPTAGPPPSTHMRKRDAPGDSVAVTTTNVRYAVGLLGSCFTSPKGTSLCTSPSMQPTFNNSWLATTPGLAIDTTGMLPALHAEPSLILVSLLVLILTSGLQVRRVHLEACKATCTLPTRRLLAALRIGTYVQDGAAVVLFAIMIYLRIQVSHANDAFNTTNGKRTVGAPALAHPGMVPTPLTLDANAGTAFSCVCVSSVLFCVLARWERMRLARETPLEGTDEEADQRWSRFLRTPMTETLRPTSRPITISAPRPIYTPDTVPVKHEAWMEVERRRLHPCPDRGLRTDLA